MIVNFDNGVTKGDKWGNFNFVRLVSGERWIDHVREEARNQSEQVEIAKMEKKAPTILRGMSKDNFCKAYGNAVREEVIDEIGDIDSDLTMKLVKAEASRRKLVFNISAIENQRIKIGITECQLFASLGFPDEQNRSVGAWGVHIQNVYDEAYIYTENGKVTSWQDKD